MNSKASINKITPFQWFKILGTPDAVLTLFSALLIVISIDPWLDISVAGTNKQVSVPWYVSLIAALTFALLFVPFIHSKKGLSNAEKELAHRFDWLRDKLLTDSLTLPQAKQAEGALNGRGGGFRAAKDEYCDKHIESIIRYDVEGFTSYIGVVEELRRLFSQLPSSYKPGEPIKPPQLVEGFRKAAAELPVTDYVQQDAPADAASRRA